MNLQARYDLEVERTVRRQAAGFDRAFLVASGIALLLLLIAIAAIRVRRADLSGS